MSPSNKDDTPKLSDHVRLDERVKNLMRSMDELRSEIETLRTKLEQQSANHWKLAVGVATMAGAINVIISKLL